MKAIVFFLLSINIFATDFSMFPQFHWTPDKPLEIMFKSLREKLLQYSRDKIRFHDGKNCVYYVDNMDQVYGYNALEICIHSTKDQNNRTFQEARYRYKWKEKTLQVYSEDPNFKGFDSKVFETLSFPKKLPKDFTLYLLEDQLRFEFYDKNNEYNHRFSSEGFGYKYVFKQVQKSPDQFVQYYHGTCSSCSNYHYSASATRVHNDHFEINYGINTQAGEISPKRFIELFTEGYLSILARTSQRIQILD